MGKNEFVSIMLIGVIATLMVQSSMGQTVHVVGDTLGWTVPGDDDVYDNWADNRIFRVGDILTFNFTTGEQDVVEVTEASYEACTATNTIGSIITTGPANITLTTMGEHHYISTFASGGHCRGGQKLEINVLAAAPGTTTPPAQPPPPPTNGPTRSPTTSPTVHVVGGTLGWIVTGDDDVYDNWADNRIFRVGDILTFNFTTGEHDVVEVTEASYDACTATNTIGSIITTGPANITLTTMGEHHYICTFGSGRHCLGGQKLEINVLAAAPGTTTPPAQPPPPPTNGPTRSPTRSPTAPPTASPTRSPTTSPASPTTSPTSPSTSPTTSPTTPGSTATPTDASPPSGSSSTVVLSSVFVTFFSFVVGMLF